MRRALRGMACLVLALSPALAAADVHIVVGSSGRKVILNENSVQRSRRLSTKLADLPDINLEAIIANHSVAQNLDPRLVRALIQAESGYNVKAVSNKGAIGLMQLMPDTASECSRSATPTTPSENVVRGGTMYLRGDDRPLRRQDRARRSPLTTRDRARSRSTAASRRSPRPGATTCGARPFPLARRAEIALSGAASIRRLDALREPSQAVPDPRRQQPARPQSTCPGGGAAIASPSGLPARARRARRRCNAAGGPRASAEAMLNLPNVLYDHLPHPAGAAARGGVSSTKFERARSAWA